MTDPRGDVYGSGPRKTPGPRDLNVDPTVDGETGRRIPDAMIDAFLDGDLKREDSAKLFSALRQDPTAAKELVGMQRAIDALRQPVSSPDLSSRILSQIGQRKGWMNWSQRKLVWRGRIAAAGLLLVLMAGVYVGQRAAPEITLAGQQPAPINELAAAVPDETADAARAVRDAVTTVRASVKSAVFTAPEPVAMPRMIAWAGPPADLPTEPSRVRIERHITTVSETSFVQSPAAGDVDLFASTWHSPSMQPLPTIGLRQTPRVATMRVTDHQAGLLSGSSTFSLRRDDLSSTTPAVIFIPGR